MDESPHDRPDLEKRVSWAENRTEWAEDRTVLANERTFAGWMRTGLASIAVALGLKAVFYDFQPSWVPRAVAMIFVISAIFVFWAAWRNASRTSKRINNHDVKQQSRPRMAAMAAMLSVGAAAIGGILWML